MRKITPVLAVAIGVVIAGCGDDAGTNVTVDPVVDTVRVQPSAVELDRPGDTVTVGATAFDASGSAIPTARLDWTTSDGTIVAISAEGLATAVSAGATTVSVTSGDATTSVPVSVLGPGLPQYDLRPTLTAGGQHGCQIKGSSSVCWGSNARGQFGNGATSIDPAYATDPGWGIDFVLLTAGNYFTCGMTSEGDGYCWGANPLGGIGVGTSEAIVTEPTRVSAEERWTYMEALAWNACGVTESGRGYCWGSNKNGQIGDSTTVDRNEPSLIAGEHTWYMISPGASHTCGVDVDKALWCWGDNARGQLGLGTTGEDVHWPTAVDPSRSWESVSAGQGKTCAIAEGGEAFCWGYEGLGDGSSGTSSIPMEVSGGHRWAQLRSALGTCGVTTVGDAYCWGRAQSGAIGSGVVYDPSTEEPVPQRVAGGHTWRTLTTQTTGSFCGETTSSEVLCWGQVSPTEVLCSSPAWAPEPVIMSEREADACALRFTSQRLRVGVRDSTYADSVGAMGGGGGPYLWEVAGGSLPGGLSLVSRGAFGVLEGVPTAAGTFEFLVRLSAGGVSVEEDVAVTINRCHDLVAPKPELPPAKVASPYSYRFEATGADGDYTWSLDGGDLPDGLSLASDGLLSGVPTRAGSLTIEVWVRSENCGSTSRVLAQLVVEP